MPIDLTGRAGKVRRGALKLQREHDVEEFQLSLETELEIRGKALQTARRRSVGGRLRRFVEWLR